MTSENGIEDQAGGTYGSSEAAAGWQRSGVARAQVLAPLTERMLDLAGVGIGHRVLDVAAGTGEQTLAVARACRIDRRGLGNRHCRADVSAGG